MTTKFQRQHRLQIEFLEQRRMLAGDVSLNLIVRDNFMPGVPVLVRAEIVSEAGTIDRDLWDATVQLTGTGASFTGETLQLVNGRGSTLITVGEPSNLVLRARWEDLQAEVLLTALEVPPVQQLSGELATDTTIGGVVHIKNDLIVPEGVTLDIEPGTLVLLDGVANDDDGARIVVQGTMRSLGTREAPVTFTASDPARAWGEIDVNGGRAEFDFSIITRAGSSPRGGHTNTGPALRLRDQGSLSLTNSSVANISGKILQSSSGNLSVVDSLLTRAVMGPEIDDTGLEFRDSWIIDMAGRFHHNGTVDDNDGIYLHSQSAGQSMEIEGSVVAVVQDDGIDTLGSDVLIHNTIVRDADDKAVSTFNGEVIIDRSLLVNSAIGVETKGSGSSTPDTQINRTTIANVDLAISARDKDSPDPDVVISFDIFNTILHVNPGGDFLRTDYDPSDLHINYSWFHEEWNYAGSGNGNVQSSPGFVAAEANDFRLAKDSPAIDAGDPAADPDPDGTRLDLGFYPVHQLPPVLGDLNGDDVVNEVDVDLLCEGIRQPPDDLRFDLDQSGIVDHADFALLIDDILGTHAGDANLDRVFNSSDLVQVFQKGQYEDGIAGNSGWGEGDWNCDGEFTTSDLVSAFQAGAYEAPPAPAAVHSSALAAALDADARKPRR